MRIVKRVLPEEGTKDRVIWALSRSGRFTCGLLCRLIGREGIALDRWKLVWSIPKPLKVKCFVRFVLRDRLMIRDRLYRMQVVQESENVCPLCGSGKENSQTSIFAL